MRKRLVLLASAVGIAAFTAGCGERSDIASPAAVAGGTASNATTATRTANLPIVRRLTPLANDVSVSATIGLLGGTILIPQAGLTVIIPPLALKTATKITLTAFKGSLVAYSFAPHGLKFALPVTVVQLTSLTNASGGLNILSTITAGYLPHDLADISASGVGSFTQLFHTSLVPAGLSIGPVMIFTTKHFSGYAFASGRTSDDDSFDYDGDDADWAPSTQM